MTPTANAKVAPNRAAKDEAPHEGARVSRREGPDGALARAATPYDGLPPRAFWRTGVAATAPHHIEGLWRPKFALSANDRFATAGSCFAQHIGRALRERGLRWVEGEPAFPLAFPLAIPEEVASRYGYGLFSFRTGNIYTARLLRQWLEWADQRRPRAEGIVEGKDGRFVDLLRPSVEPAGYATRKDAVAARSATLRAIRSSLKLTDVFVFTLGLTEVWFDRRERIVYPMCPGTVAGCYDPRRHVLRNMRHAEVASDVRASIALMRRLRPGLRVLLSVSPVPLTATATDEHVLSATVYSKSVLRAVAGEVAADDRLVDYVPSYEIIAAHWSKGRYFEENLRAVSAEGVTKVMEMVFAAFAPAGDAGSEAKEGRAERLTRQRASIAGLIKAQDVVCEEALLDAAERRS